VARVDVPGVSENWPLLSMGDLVRFRFQMWDIHVEVIGEVVDIEIKSEVVAILLPSPFIGQVCSSAVVPYLQAVLTTKQHFVDASEVLHTMDAGAWPAHDLDEKKHKQSGRFDLRFGFLGGIGFKIASAVLSQYQTGRIGESTRKLKHLRRLVAPNAASSKISHFSSRQRHNDLTWRQSLNDEQRRAVLDIVHKSHGDVPYLIFGPFGTGKSLTIVECILQVLMANPNAKILICAPSDAACDVLAKRIYPFLGKVKNNGVGGLLRVNWWARKLASLPVELLPVSTMNSKGFFVLPKITEMRQASVIICQCFVAGVLEMEPNSTNWLKSHFTHVFVDETSQAMETEIMVPLSMVCFACRDFLSQCLNCVF
jgi:hypothetical protein